MQQYFVDQTLNINQKIILDDDVLYHLKKVLRKTNTVFRLVDKENKVYLATLIGNEAIVTKELNENNELNIKITAIISLIKQDKFELTLTKLTELGVDRIVPYKACRSIVKDNRIDSKLLRYKKILKEASEQSHRNKIPEIVNAISINELSNYTSTINFIPYEKEKSISKIDLISDSISYIIGPEGGFEDEEYKKIVSLGFNSISLGSRILRSETAAIYLASIIAEANK